MKKLILGLIGALVLVTSSQAAVISVACTTNGFYLFSTNRASVYSVEFVGSTTAAGTVTFYDCDSIADPFNGTKYTNAAWVSRIAYATNYYTTNVGYNGYTNFYTNVGISTITTTNAAATNTLPIMAAFSVQSGTVATYNSDALFSRGICAVVTTNITVTINYRSAQ